MAGSLGKAYVQIVPSAEGIAGKLQAAIAPEAKIAGAGAGKSLSANLGNGLKSIGGAMTSYITKPAMAAVTALGGATLFSGWKRMTEIDNAKVKLEAIGNTTKDVTKIQQNAMEAVKGTAFGMNAAMTTSASAVAAGIKPGKELTKYLTAISDAAAVAGTDMSSMGAIFNKVATSGKAQNDVLSQMADAGIPIYQDLADQMGVTADKVFEMASAGEVGLADFQAAVSTHIGGAAQEMGSKTITGAIENVKASISRIGANFLGSADDANSFAGKVLPMLNNLMQNLGPVEEKAKELGSKFADAFGKFAEAIGKVPLPVLGGIASALVGLGPAIGIITKLQAVFTALGITISAPVAAVIAIGAAFALVYAKSETFRNAVNGLVAALASALMPVFKAAGDVIKTLITEVMSIASAIGSALAPVIKTLTPVFKAVAQVIGAVLVSKLQQLQGIIKVVATVVKTIASIFKTAFNAAKNAVTSAGSAIKSTGSKIQSALSFGGLGGKVKSVFNTIKKAISNPIDTAKGLVQKAVGAIKGFFPVSIGNVMSNLKLPHFSISGKFSINPPSIPKFGVSWYKKAEGQPYMFSNATLFGAGEHNDEILYGRDALMSDIKDAVGSGSTGNVVNLNVTVNGAENPDDWADRFARRIELEMRTR